MTVESNLSRVLNEKSKNVIVRQDKTQLLYGEIGCILHCFSIGIGIIFLSNRS